MQGKFKTWGLITKVAGLTAVPFITSYFFSAYTLCCCVLGNASIQDASSGQEAAEKAELRGPGDSGGGRKTPNESISNKTFSPLQCSWHSLSTPSPQLSCCKCKKGCFKLPFMPVITLKMTHCSNKPSPIQTEGCWLPIACLWCFETFSLSDFIFCNFSLLHLLKK